MTSCSKSKCKKCRGTKAKAEKEKAPEAQPPKKLVDEDDDVRSRCQVRTNLDIEAGFYTQSR